MQACNCGNPERRFFAEEGSTSLPEKGEDWSEPNENISKISLRWMVRKAKCKSCKDRGRLLASNDPDENETVPCAACAGPNLDDVARQFIMYGDYADVAARAAALDYTMPVESGYYQYSTNTVIFPKDGPTTITERHGGPRVLA